MNKNESTMVGLAFAAVGVLGMIFLDRVVHGTTHTVFASAVIVMLLTASLVLHHAGGQLVTAMRRESRVQREIDYQRRSIR